MLELYSELWDHTVGTHLGPYLEVQGRYNQATTADIPQLWTGQLYLKGL